MECLLNLAILLLLTVAGCLVATWWAKGPEKRHPLEP